MKKKLTFILSVVLIIMACFAFIFSFPTSDVDFRGLIEDIDKYDDVWIIKVLDSTDTNYVREVYIDTKTKILDVDNTVIPLSNIQEGIFVDISFRRKSDETIADKVKIFSPDKY